MAKNAREVGWTEGYKLTEKVDNMINFTDIEVAPRVLYMFQAIAREDKGVIGGVAYNKSPPREFKTERPLIKWDAFISGVSNELLIIITIACLFGFVVIVGILYKLSGYRPKITIVEDDDDDEDDLLDEKEQTMATKWPVIK